ncbi:MAG: ATP-binding cassette domain-containing protein [Sphaerochaeta sp.]
MNPIIELSHATVQRLGQPILNDVSFCVYENQHVAIIGPNGAGKSTLVQTFSMEVHPLYSPDFKRILFSQSRWEILELRKHLGIVSASLQYLCTSTYKAWEIVVSGFFSSIGLDFHHQVEEKHIQRATEVMERYGILWLWEKQMNRLSSGEARRVLLARASVHEPEVMLLDEASTALDFPSRRAYRNLLEQLNREGKTIILATHELSEIIPAINRVVVMKHGTIVADGPKETILTEELLSEVYEAPIYLDCRDGLYSVWS